LSFGKKREGQVEFPFVHPVDRGKNASLSIRLPAVTRPFKRKNCQRIENRKAFIETTVQKKDLGIVEENNIARRELSCRGFENVKCLC